MSIKVDGEYNIIINAPEIKETKHGFILQCKGHKTGREKAMNGKTYITRDFFSKINILHENPLVLETLRDRIWAVDGDKKRLKIRVFKSHMNGVIFQGRLVSFLTVELWDYTDGEKLGTKREISKEQTKIKKAERKEIEVKVKAQCNKVLERRKKKLEQKYKDIYDKKLKNKTKSQRKDFHSMVERRVKEEKKVAAQKQREKIIEPSGDYGGVL